MVTQDAACRDLFANGGAPRTAVIGDVQQALDYYLALETAGRAPPFWANTTATAPGVVGWFGLDVCTRAIAMAMNASHPAAWLATDPDVQRLLDALLRYRGYLQTGACADPLKQMVYDGSTGIATCITALDVAMTGAVSSSSSITSDETTNALAMGVSITLIVVVALGMLAVVVLAVRNVRAIERLANVLHRGPSLAPPPPPASSSSSSSTGYSNARDVETEDFEEEEEEEDGAVYHY